MNLGPPKETHRIEPLSPPVPKPSSPALEPRKVDK